MSGFNPDMDSTLLGCCQWNISWTGDCFCIFGGGFVFLGVLYMGLLTLLCIVCQLLFHSFAGWSNLQCKICSVSCRVTAFEGWILLNCWPIQGFLWLAIINELQNLLDIIIWAHAECVEGKEGVLLMQAIGKCEFQGFTQSIRIWNAGGNTVLHDWI